MPTLYQTYRPQSWDQIEAQTHVKQTLMHEIISGTVAHAFLFTGPRGTGKTTTARLLAKALNCKNRAADSAEPCNTCESCLEIAKGNGVDVIEIDAASHTGVDNVREHVIETARFAPTRSTYKIFIIDEVHMLSNSAFNALLKTLEEPPHHVVFIMATTETHKVPATIISRCQKFDFRHLNTDTIIGRLKKISEKESRSVEDNVIQHIAWRANGSMRDAESLLGQVLSASAGSITKESASVVLPERSSTDTIAYLESLLTGNVAQGFDVVNRIVGRGMSIPHFLDDAIDTMRSLMVFKALGSFGATYFTEEDREKLTKLSSDFDLHRMMAVIDGLLSRRATLGQSPILHLPLELLVAQMSVVEKAAPVKRVAAQVVQIAPVVESDSSPANGRLGGVSPEEPTIAESLTPSNSPFAGGEPSQPTTQTSPNPSLAGGAQDQSATTPELQPPPAPPTIEGEPLTTQTIEFAAIEEKWDAFVDHTQTYNHSLPFVLKTGKPLRIEGSTIVVSVPYALHAKRISDMKVQEVIRKATTDIWGTVLSITAELDASRSSSVQEDAVSKVLETFGGSVVAA